MDWYHKADLEWMRARQLFVTASDVKKMMPVTPAGNKRSKDLVEKAMADVWASKLKTLNDDDAVSYGAAARGHAMEPFAIDEFNDHHVAHLHHWDDALVARTDVMLAFSPDAMEIEQPQWMNGVIESTWVPISMNNIGEVKSYSVENHYRCGLVPKLKLEERWQIAVAMAVLAQVQLAYLILYNPACRHPMFVREYVPSELSREIEIVLETTAAYHEFAKGKIDEAEHAFVDARKYTEQQINQLSNPQGKQVNP